MHSLYFVKVAEAKNRKEGRDEAQRELEANAFVSEGGYFSGAKADWFVVGGRWSGELQMVLMKKSYFEELKKVCPPEDKSFGYTNKDIEKNRKQFQEVWEKLGGKGNNPYARNQYDFDGSDDDAMKITRELIKALKKKNYKDVEVFDAEHCEEYGANDLTKDDIGKWLVVIDYHS